MIVFRADASTLIGSGHVARCLTLAHALREKGLRSVFVSRSQPGEPFALIEANGFESLRLPRADSGRDDPAALDVESAWAESDQIADAAQTLAAVQHLGEDVSWMVVDHYGLDATWERSIAPCAARTLVIDDLANRRHACDMLLDQNYYVGLERRYDGLVPRNCRVRLGPRHVLLRREFHEAKAAMRRRDGVVRRILVAFGSNDHGGETIKALAALRSLGRAGIAIDVVAGASNPRCAELRSLCASLGDCTYHEQVDYMARLISAADLGLGAGGSSTWERCALGLPSLTIVTANNQLQTAIDTSAAGAIVFLGESNAVDDDDIAAAAASAIDHPEQIREVATRALSLVPTADGANQLADAMSDASRAVVPGHPISPIAGLS